MRAEGTTEKPGGFRQRQYRGERALAEAVEAYFRSISRTVTLTEEYETGEYTEKGVALKARREVRNDAGEVIRVTEYAAPPTIGALCLHLGISTQTWGQYCDPARYPAFAGVIAGVRTRMESYLESELLSRQRGIQGVQEMLGKLQAQSGRQPQTGQGELSLSEKLTIIESAVNMYQGSGGGHGSQGGE